MLLILVGMVACEKEDDASTAFIDAARALFADKDAIGGLQGMASAFMQSDAGKQVVKSTFSMFANIQLYSAVERWNHVNCILVLYIYIYIYL